MKYFAFFIIIASLGFGIFNITKIDFNNAFGEESIVGMITILASLCAIMLMLILLTSKRIEDKLKKRN